MLDEYVLYKLTKNDHPEILAEYKKSKQEEKRFWKWQFLV